MNWAPHRKTGPKTCLFACKWVLSVSAGLKPFKFEETFLGVLVCVIILIRNVLFSKPLRPKPLGTQVYVPRKRNVAYHLRLELFINTQRSVLLLAMHENFGKRMGILLANAKRFCTRDRTPLVFRCRYAPFPCLKASLTPSIWPRPLVCTRLLSPCSLTVMSVIKTPKRKGWRIFCYHNKITGHDRVPSLFF